jgi:hypothetical protein
MRSNQYRIYSSTDIVEFVQQHTVAINPKWKFGNTLQPWSCSVRTRSTASGSSVKRTCLFECMGDAGADQGLVADDLEGQADQDRREGGEPRPLCYLPDGRGRHRTANVPGDFAAHRGTAAAATTSAQPIEGVRPNARKMAGSDPRPSVRITRGAGSSQHLASVLQEGRESANIDAGLGFIWRISV